MYDGIVLETTKADFATSQKRVLNELKADINQLIKVPR